MTVAWFSLSFSSRSIDAETSSVHELGEGVTIRNRRHQKPPPNAILESTFSALPARPIHQIEMSP
jgi:hypothetical protein